MSAIVILRCCLDVPCRAVFCVCVLLFVSLCVRARLRFGCVFIFVMRDVVVCCVLCKFLRCVAVDNRYLCAFAGAVVCSACVVAVVAPVCGATFHASSMHKV